MITIEYVLKKLAQKRHKKRFQHKTSYGRTMENKYGYDHKGHEEHYQRIKNTPYSPELWDK